VKRAASGGQRLSLSRYDFEEKKRSEREGEEPKSRELGGFARRCIFLYLEKRETVKQNKEEGLSSM
jgi:hypothetical protein